MYRSLDSALLSYVCQINPMIYDTIVSVSSFSITIVLLHSSNVCSAGNSVRRLARAPVRRRRLDQHQAQDRCGCHQRP